MDPRQLPGADELLPWDVYDVSLDAGRGWWSFNPSIHYDPLEERWRIAYRVANYCLPGGVPRLSGDARLGRAHTRCVVADVDPGTLAIDRLHEVREIDGLPRVPSCASTGLEDMRLFRTARDGILGVATALQYNLERPSCPEIVLVRFDDAGDAAEVTPLRGLWSASAQKNWAPFDGAQGVRLLYSIERGVVMDESGPISSAPPIPPVRSTGVPIATANRTGVEVRVVTPRGAPRPPQAPQPPGSSELRGGSQLVEVAPDQWLGIGHEMRLTVPDRRKLYWHTFYVVDSMGRMIGRSPPMKLSTRHGIEFAAGLAVDRAGRLAVSLGVDDHRSMVGVTDLDAVLALVAETQCQSRTTRSLTGIAAT